jgi:glycosyltransferase involved in cell wall biosynthesis
VTFSKPFRIRAHFRQRRCVPPSKSGKIRAKRAPQIPAILAIMAIPAESQSIQSRRSPWQRRLRLFPVICSNCCITRAPGLKSFPPVLRVGFDARWYNDSGVGTYVVELLKSLVAQNDLALVVYEDLGNPVPSLDDLRVTRVPVRSNRYSLAAQWEFRRRAAEDKLHLFHSPFFDVPLALNCPVVATIHDLIPFLFRVDSWPRQQMVKAGYRLATRRARHLISVSENTARDMQNLLRVPREKITVVHNAAARNCFHPACQEGEAEWLSGRYGVRAPYFLAASAWNWRHKNLESALRSLQSLRQMAGTKFQTVVYGPPEGLLATGGKQRWIGLDLAYIGPVPHATLAALFRHATGFVMPALYEGFGLPVLEAMSCGCPVVTSNASSLAEVAAGGAQLFDPMDCDGMSAALAALLRDSSTHRQWTEKALKRSADFSWEKAARETITAYHRALESLA